MKRNLNILLVENNEGEVLLIREAIKEAELDVELIVAKDAEMASNILFQIGHYADFTKPNLVLLDINLPKMNGHELLSEIKTSKTLKQIPVIMLSSSTRRKDVIKSYDNHANGYLVKPTDIFSYVNLLRKTCHFWLSTVLVTEAYN